MTSEKQMEVDAISLFSRLMVDPTTVYISKDGTTIYANVKGSVVAIQSDNEDFDFNKATPEEITLALRNSFPGSF